MVLTVTTTPRSSERRLDMRPLIFIAVLAALLGPAAAAPRTTPDRPPVITFLGWDYLDHSVIPCDGTLTTIQSWPNITTYITAYPRVTAPIEEDIVQTTPEGEIYHSLNSVGVAPGSTRYSVFGENQVVGTYEWILWEDGTYAFRVDFGGSSATCTINVVHGG
jgi:hypothetical protein